MTPNENCISTVETRSTMSSCNDTLSKVEVTVGKRKVLKHFDDENLRTPNVNYPINERRNSVLQKMEGKTNHSWVYYRKVLRYFVVLLAVFNR